MDDFRGNERNMSQFENMQQQMAKVFPERTIEVVVVEPPHFPHVF
jgi:hypothetical protein